MGYVAGDGEFWTWYLGTVQGDPLETVHGNQYQGAGDSFLFGAMPRPFEWALSEEAC